MDIDFCLDLASLSLSLSLSLSIDLLYHFSLDFRFYIMYSQLHIFELIRILIKFTISYQFKLLGQLVI
jgi:hypothetical protein